MNILNDSGHQPLPSGHIDYDDLHALESDLLAAVGGKQIFEEKLRSFFRSAIDEVIDTARTNRFFLSQLEKQRKPISAPSSRICFVTGYKCPGASSLT